MTSMDLIEHEFDEVGFPLGGGWTFGSVSGKVSVGFDHLGEWWIEDVHVEITKLVAGQWRRVSYMLDRTKPLERRWYHDLRSLIENAEKSEIDEKVAEALADRKSHAGVDQFIERYRGK